MGKLIVAEMRDLEKQVSDGEISYSRMVEIINQKFEHALTDDEIRAFAIDAVTMDGGALNAIREHVANAVIQGAKWARHQITGLHNVPPLPKTN